MHEAVKYWDENCSQTVPALQNRTISSSFVDQYIKFKEAIIEHGPFNRVNEPLLFATDDMNQI